jgi:hypothetical protein
MQKPKTKKLKLNNLYESGSLLGLRSDINMHSAFISALGWLDAAFHTTGCSMNSRQEA